MRLASFQPSSNPRAVPLRRRAASLVLVLLVHLLMLLMLLRITPPLPPSRPAGGQPITFQLLREKRVAPKRAKTVSKAKRASGGAAARPLAASRVPVPKVVLPSSASAIWSRVIPLTREELAAADIAKMPSRKVGREPDTGTASGLADGSDGGPTGLGEGPNGERLYEAQWYRKPTDAELANYLPSSAPANGWGMIACQTVAGYRVENCRELGQSPAGSGLAGAVRQAAWQFRVLPPRIGGRQMVGAWVRIRIDYTQHRVE